MNQYNVPVTQEHILFETGPSKDRHSNSKSYISALLLHHRCYAGGPVSSDGQRGQSTVVFKPVAPMPPHQKAGHLDHVHPPLSQCNNQINKQRATQFIINVKLDSLGMQVTSSLQHFCSNLVQLTWVYWKSLSKMVICRFWPRMKDCNLRV